MGTLGRIGLVIFSLLASFVAFGDTITNNNSILYKNQIGVIPLVGTHNLSNKYAPLLVDANGVLQTVEIDSATYQPAATTTVVSSLSKVFVPAGDGKPVVAAPIVGVYNGNYVPIATDGLGRLILTAPANTGITSLNNLNASDQLFAAGTSGTDFAIVSAAGTHTFNLPSASATARGLVTTGVQTLAGVKTFSTTPVFGALSTGILHSNVSGTLSSSTLVNTDVAANANIDYSKLAVLSSANIVLGNVSNVATSTAVSGDITISNAGVTALAATLAGNKTLSNNLTVTGTTTNSGATTFGAAINLKATFITTTPVTLDATHHVVLSNLATASIVNLPDCSAAEGRSYVFKNINVGAATLTPTSGQKIDGATTKTVNVKYAGVNLLCASSNWYLY